MTDKLGNLPSRCTHRDRTTHVASNAVFFDQVDQFCCQRCWNGQATLVVSANAQVSHELASFLVASECHEVLASGVSVFAGSKYVGLVVLGNGREFCHFWSLKFRFDGSHGLDDRGRWGNTRSNNFIDASLYGFESLFFGGKNVELGVECFDLCQSLVAAVVCFQSDICKSLNLNRNFFQSSSNFCDFHIKSFQRNFSSQ